MASSPISATAGVSGGSSVAGRRGIGRALKRMALKTLIFVIVLIGVLYPYPNRLWIDLHRVIDFNQLIDPNAPELATLDAPLMAFIADSLPKKGKTPLGQEVRSASPAGFAQRYSGAPTVGPAATGQPAGAPVAVAASQAVGASQPSTSAATVPVASTRVYQAVEAFVYKTVKYDWDWNIWGVANYTPTVGEMFAKAREYPDGGLREDCDGRAVLAASLLRRLGYDAMLATDFAHVWVVSRDPLRKETVGLMSPGKVRTVTSTATGNKLLINWQVIANLPRELCYSVSVFPWLRELIIFATLQLLLFHRNVPWRITAVGVLLNFAGWTMIRSVPDYWSSDIMNGWFGLLYVALGVGVLLRASHRARRMTDIGFPLRGQIA